MQRNQYQYTTYGALEQYMRVVGWMPRLEESEEERLLLLLESEECKDNARTRLVEGYQSLIIALAKRYVRNCAFVELMDLVQEGNIGLLQAIDRYDLSDRSASFKTWAFTWVRGAMMAALCQHERTFHMPAEKIKAIKRLERVSERLLSLLGREPTIVEIAQEMRVEVSEVRELVVLRGQEVFSLYLPVDEEGETWLVDVIEDPAASFVEDIFSSTDDLLAHLTGRERAVVKLRYGFEDGQAYTQREVAELLGMELSVVAMVDRTAKKRLRKVLEEVVA